MNPDTNRFEELCRDAGESSKDTLMDALANREPLLPGQLVRANGSPVPDHWSTFTVGDEIPIRGYVFRVAYIGETSILFEPVGTAVEIAKASG